MPSLIGSYTFNPTVGTVTFTPPLGGNIDPTQVLSISDVTTKQLLYSSGQRSLGSASTNVFKLPSNSPLGGTKSTDTLNIYYGPSSTVVAIAPSTTSTTSQFNLNTSSTETIIVNGTLNQLLAGSAVRIQVFGTIQVQSTSGPLTFTTYVGTNASAETFVMPTQTSAAGPVPFTLDAICVVRTASATGTYVTNGYGRIEFATPVLLTPSSIATAVVDTTVASPLIKITATWGTNSATNILKVETATIERVV
jgi:hypothetical protein